MATTGGYQGPASVTLQNGDGASLGANTFGYAITANLANGANLGFYVDIELLGTFAATPAGGEVIELHRVVAPDGTNFEDGPDATAPQRANTFIGGKLIRAVSTAQRFTWEKVWIGPNLTKFGLYNGSAKGLNANWTLKAFWYGTKST